MTAVARSLGEWNAYVAAGKTRGERRRRLEEAPDGLRPSIESHVRTVFAIRARQQHRRDSRDRAIPHA